ncbi:MAG: UpxY family transcription antiterminator [Ferruginibacter sp.]
MYTRPRWEKKVAQNLSNRGFENYCPLNRVRKQWSDRKKLVLEPLFKGYVFVRVEESRKWDIKLIDGVVNFVYWLGKPARVKESEITTIKKFLQEFEDVEVVDSQLDVHSKVVVKRGVFMNYHGIILDVTGNRARVFIDSMGIQLCAQFDKNNLAPVDMGLK